MLLTSKNGNKMKRFIQYIESEVEKSSVIDVFNIISSKFPKEAADFLNRYSTLSGVNAPEGGFKEEDFTKNNRSKQLVVKGLGDVGIDDVKHSDDVIAGNYADSYH